MPDWIWIAVYLFIGGVIAKSFSDHRGEPDYGFATVVMLFWPLVAFMVFLLMFVTLINTFKGK